MAEVFMDAAVAMRPNRAIFFINDQYVVYDYSAVDRVVDGVHSIDHFPQGSPTGFPADLFQPAPLFPKDRRLAAAIAGKGPFAGALYFFSGSQYVRFDDGAGFAAVGARNTSAEWHLAPPVNVPDGAFNGARNRKAYCYFFKDSRYWRYIWSNGRVDANYPREIGTLVGMPALFASGIDAAVDGVNSDSTDEFEAGYLFKDDKYVRFNWVNDGGGEPHADDTRSIADAWPGLLELLAAARAKSEAQAFLSIAIPLTAQRAAGTLTGAPLALVDNALSVHFKASDPATLAAVVAGMTSIATTLQSSPTMFRFRNLLEATADQAPEPPSAAYTWGVGQNPAFPAGMISFSPLFLSRSADNRTLSVLHEAVHVFDLASGTPANHIPEWWVSPGARAAFGLPAVIGWAGAAPPPTFYDTQPAGAAIHNPAAFAAYVRHVARGIDSRALP